MTMFEQELSGAFGPVRKMLAEKEIEKMQKHVDNDEIRTAICGGAFWASNGNYLHADAAEALAHTDFPFSLEETNRCREAQNALFLKEYAENHQTTEEEKVEMRAAFGPGTTVVDAISGERISL